MAEIRNNGRSLRSDIIQIVAVILCLWVVYLLYDARPAVESIEAWRACMERTAATSGRNIPDDFTTNQFCRYNIPAFLWLVPLLNLMKHRVNSYEPRAISIIGYVLPSYLKLIAKSHYIQSPLLQDRSHYPLCVLYKEGLCGIQIEP